jgi:hypothetical protein
MSKVLVLLLMLGAVMALAWTYRDRLGGAVEALSPTSAAPPRKCVAAGGSVLYTQEACPPGSREAAVTGGAVSVLPAAPPRPAAAASGGGLPNVRDALLGPGAQGAGDLKDRQMDRVIGR